MKEGSANWHDMNYETLLLNKCTELKCYTTPMQDTDRPAARSSESP